MWQLPLLLCLVILLLFGSLPAVYRLPRLIKDNDFIYHEVVPVPESLELIKGKFGEFLSSNFFVLNDVNIYLPSLFLTALWSESL